MQIREVKQWYVEYLAQKIKENPGDTEDLTAPLVVVCNETKDHFDSSKVDYYTYEVIGGSMQF